MAAGSLDAACPLRPHAQASDAVTWTSWLARACCAGDSDVACAGVFCLRRFGGLWLWPWRSCGAAAPLVSRSLATAARLRCFLGALFSFNASLLATSLARLAASRRKMWLRPIFTASAPAQSTSALSTVAIVRRCVGGPLCGCAALWLGALWLRALTIVILERVALDPAVAVLVLRSHRRPVELEGGCAIGGGQRPIRLAAVATHVSVTQVQQTQAVMQ
jgi:hypothetical protein